MGRRTTTWKNDEMRVAKWFRSTRTPLSGGNSKQTRADTLHPKLFIEVKRRANHHLVRLFRETKKLAIQEGKVPVVAPVMGGHTGAHEKEQLVLVDIRDLPLVSKEVRVPLLKLFARSPTRKKLRPIHRKHKVRVRI